MINDSSCTRNENRGVKNKLSASSNLCRSLGIEVKEQEVHNKDVISFVS